MGVFLAVVAILAAVVIHFAFNRPSRGRGFGLRLVLIGLGIVAGIVALLLVATWFWYLPARLTASVSQPQKTPVPMSDTLFPTTVVSASPSPEHSP